MNENKRQMYRVRYLMQVVNGHCGASVAYGVLARFIAWQLVRTRERDVEKKKGKEEDPSRNDFASRPIERPFHE